MNLWQDRFNKKIKEDANERNSNYIKKNIPDRKGSSKIIKITLSKAHRLISLKTERHNILLTKIFQEEKNI